MAVQKAPSDILNELGTRESESRKALDGKSRDQAHRALADMGIDIPKGKVPNPVKLPDADKVRAVTTDAQNASILGDPEATKYLILAMVVGAIPFVAADRHGSG